MSTTIKDVISRKVFNSRGEETIEVDVITDSTFGRASGPAGKSRGKAEVVYYPVGGVDKAVELVKTDIAPHLIGLDAQLQEDIDKTLHDLDGTESFEKIGGNTAFSISLANAEAAANSRNQPLFKNLSKHKTCKLPYPLGNVISGGKHGGARTPDFQEFLVFPSGAKSFLEAAFANIQIHRRLSEILREKDAQFSMGRSDEGAWIANIGDLEALETLTRASNEVSNELNIEFRLGIDVAASSLWNSKKEKYIYKRGQTERDSLDQLEFLREIIEEHNLFYVEDPFHEEDYASSAELVSEIKNCLICGDDLYVTNAERLKRGIELKAANSVIIKVNQVGTLTDAHETIKLAKQSRHLPVVSHRSGDTCNQHISHLAVAFNCPIIKSGIIGGTRIAKTNELLRIENSMLNRVEMADL